MKLEFVRKKLFLSFFFNLFVIFPRQLLFNMRETLSYEELKDETLIPDRELTRALQPLAIGKASQRILIKTPKTKEIEPSHTFQVIYQEFVT